MNLPDLILVLTAFATVAVSARPARADDERLNLNT